MARLPYTQGTKAYLASLAVLRGENDSRKIAADVGTSLKNVQNVRSIVRKLLKAPVDSDSEKIPVTPVTVPPPVTPSSVTVIDSRSAPQPPATPSHREAAPAVQSRPEERSVEEGKASLEKGSPGNGSLEKGVPGNRRETREDSQEGDGRESQSTSSRETEASHRESVTTGRELREARKDMRLVKAKEKEFDMQDGAAMGCLMDRELALQATPIVKKVILNPKIYLYYDYAVSTFDFKGDIGDFIQDAVEDFWKSRGYRIVIERKSEVELR